LVGQSLALTLGLDVHELLQLASKLDALDRVVSDAKPDERVSEAHYAEADAPNPLGESVDLGKRVFVDVDDVVEEVDGEVDVALERVPIHLRILHVIPDVDRAEVAD